MSPLGAIDTATLSYAGQQNRLGENAQRLALNCCWRCRAGADRVSDAVAGD